MWRYSIDFMKKLHPVEKERFTNRGLVFINRFLDVCSKITNILCKIMCNQYPMSYYWGTDGRTDARTDGRTDGRTDADFLMKHISGSDPDIHVLKVSVAV